MTAGLIKELFAFVIFFGIYLLPEISAGIRKKSERDASSGLTFLKVRSYPVGGNMNMDSCCE